MAIQLNEEIRDEARKMSEYVIEDTKRTVEMLDWLKGKRQPENNGSVLTDIIKTGANLASGNIIGGMGIMIENILPRLRDRLSHQFITDESFTKNKNTVEAIRKINDKVVCVRNMLTENKLDANDIDDVLYDIQVILSDTLKTL